MCNAWNHSYGCTCGWGGDGHSGVSPGRGFNALEMAARLFYGHQEGPSYSNAKSFTDPNAICPVCGAEVFFYRSPYNGRVFFDSLGPPWPKHSCTDSNSQSRFAFPTLIRRVSESLNASKPIWSKEGWQPFVLREVSSIPSLPGCIRIRGVFGSQGKELFLKVSQLPDGALLQVRHIEPGTYEVSVMSVDAKGNISSEVLASWDSVTKLVTMITKLSTQSSPTVDAIGALSAAFTKVLRTELDK
jgi:hypothetical protein